jgi:hypothetical protein
VVAFGRLFQERQSFDWRFFIGQTGYGVGLQSGESGGDWMERTDVAGEEDRKGF